MTERELKAMYENASLPEERMAELEKRFISKVEAMPQDAPLNPVIDEESAHVELKPAPPAERRNRRMRGSGGYGGACRGDNVCV